MTPSGPELPNLDEAMLIILACGGGLAFLLGLVAGLLGWPAGTMP